MNGSEAVSLVNVSFRYLDESEMAGQEREPPETGSRICGVSLDVAYGSCMVICGRSGDGKSTVACNLARVMALAGRSVVLIDGDLRRRRRRRRCA